MAYEIQWSEEPKADMHVVPAFRRGPVFAAIEQLRGQAETQTRNRKLLAEPIEDLPDATWEVRAGDYRAFYRIEEGGPCACFGLSSRVRAQRRKP